MQILGIGDHVSCGSALVRDGKLIAAITDERIVREKMVFGVPRESIKMILKTHRISPSEIDAIAIASKNQHFIGNYKDYKDGWFGDSHRTKFKKKLFALSSYISKYRTHFPFLDKIYYTLRQPAFIKRRKELKRILRKEFGFECPVHFIDHHFCHITSAYYTSGYRDATVVSIDGGGDGRSGRIYDVVNGEFKESINISSFDSLGCFYSYVTQLCGYKAGKHEGKITGLAAYGKPEYIPLLKKIMVSQNGTVKNVANVFFLSALKEFKRLLPKDFSHSNLAASMQIYTEDMVVDIVKHWLEKTNHYNIALAGGIFANVKINQRVHEIPGVQSVFVHPGMSDEGMPVGAALALYYNHSGATYDPDFDTMEHVYLGQEFSDEEICQELEKQDVGATRYDEVEHEIARLLAGGSVVARFNGKMEYGPRALGNRTILYQPNDPTVNYWMNDALKRTEFMPFAPVVMAEDAHKCFKNLKGAENTARFMTITFDCTEWMAKSCPGVVHIDNTARPQLVTEKDNPSMYGILAEYYKMTGLPLLINTSFNMHEEPIVCTPYDAIRAFKLGHLDFLAIGNYIAKNPNPIERRVDKNKFQSKLNRRGSVSS
ncbi:MAG: carbamoyltransferase C-terminal domain-containing protein [Candidatus Scalinduaceae bacterium]